ncbi:hypothetical protein [Mesorhizobium erdmanii]|uniref:hypothetical protein n=1 Tax=Mesorhizobium erdmanii TaxID=1777866 RepID=UPI0012B5DFFE|nr:hypothetical protein [Mesorhizobium erdmanii]
MAGKLATYLTDIAKDHAKMTTFKADPYSAMNGAGLSDKEITAVLSKKPELISQAIGGRGGLAAADADTTVVVVVL